MKIDPNFLKLNRELRDRYLEQVNRTSNAPLLARAGKYDVTRAFAAPPIRPQLPWDREEQRGGELRVGS